MASVDTSSLSQAISSVRKNIRFGVARGLTQMARIAADDATDHMPSVFDRPTPFTQKAVAIQPARRDNLSATVFIKDAQARYLAMQEHGGERMGRKGSPINIAVAQRLNTYGNIPRGAIKRERDKATTFVSTGKGRTAHLVPGIYRRPVKGVRRDGSKGVKGALRHGGKGRKVGGTAAKGASGLKLLVAFRRSASYSPRFGFAPRIKAMVDAKASSVISASVAEALRSAR